MGTALAAPGQRLAGHQRHGQHCHRTLYAQRENPLARRTRHSRRTRTLLESEQRERPPAPRDSTSLPQRRPQQGGRPHDAQLQQHRALRGKRRTLLPLRLLHHPGRIVHRNRTERQGRPPLSPRPLSRFGLGYRFLHGQRRGLSPRDIRQLPAQRDGHPLLRLAKGAAATPPGLYAQSLCRGKGQGSGRRQPDLRGTARQQRHAVRPAPPGTNQGGHTHGRRGHTRGPQCR